MKAIAYIAALGVLWIVQPGQAQLVSAQAAKGVTVRGVAVNVPKEIPSKVARLHMSNAPGSPLETTLNDDGSFEFSEVLPGSHALDFMSPASRLSIILVENKDLSDLKLDLHNNPFPEFPGGSFAAVFDYNTGHAVTLRGIITQEATAIRPPAPVCYFRMDVVNGSTGIRESWAINFTNPGRTEPGIALYPTLKTGTAVTISVNPDRSGIHRGYLVYPKDQSPLTGIVLQ